MCTGFSDQSDWRGADGCAKHPASPTLTSVRYTHAGKQLPIGNGGVGPGYWWTQTLGEVTVYLDVPADARGKDVALSIRAASIDLRLKGAPTPLLAGPLGGDIKPREALWTLDSDAPSTRASSLSRPADPTLPDELGLPPALRRSGRGSTGVESPPTSDHSGWKVLTLVLEKGTQTWWRSVLALPGHPEVDATAVDSTQRVDEYNDETQAAIRKAVFDQAQRAKGLPTSDELAISGLVQAARLQPGSPFGSTLDVNVPDTGLESAATIAQPCGTGR